MKNKNFRKDIFETSSGIPIKAVYTPEDLEKIKFEYGSFLGFPGEFPFTRGISPQMYRDNLWIMGQYSGYGSAEETNKRLKFLIESGQTGFSLALDLPTQLGLDSDDGKAEGEVGKVGVPIDTLQDLEIIFADIPFDRMRQIRTTANAIAPIVLSLFIALFEKKGFDPNKIKVLIQNDILKEYISRGTYIFPIDPSLKLCIDVIEYCTKYLPGWNPISICGYHIREAGSTAVQEIAFTLANAKGYIERALERGLMIDDFVRNIYVMLSVNLDFFEEIAKFRAMRRMWARLLKDHYKAKNAESMKQKLFAFTAGSTLTMQTPLNNIVRVTIEALASVLGGVQVLATSSYDEVFSLPTDEAVEIALRTQQIIAYETGTISTIDPLGGSYFIEVLTNNIQEEVTKCMAMIESQGGMIEAIRRGFVKGQIEESAYNHQRLIEKNQKIVVGLNKFTDGKPLQYRTLRIDEKSEKKQIERLKDIKKGRKSEKVVNALNKLKKSAESGENVVPSILEAIRHYTTLGEICSALKEVFGEYKQTI